MLPPLEMLRPTTELGGELLEALRSGDSDWFAAQEPNQPIMIPPLRPMDLLQISLLYGPPNIAIDAYDYGDEPVDLSTLFGPKWEGVEANEQMLLLLNPHAEARAHALKEFDTIAMMSIQTEDEDIEITDAPMSIRCLWYGTEFNKPVPYPGELLDQNIDTIQYLVEEIRREGVQPESKSGKALAKLLLPPQAVEPWKLEPYHTDPRLIPLYPTINEVLATELATQEPDYYLPRSKKTLDEWLTSYAQSFIKLKTRAQRNTH